MNSYLVSLAAGIPMGVIYHLLNVCSPAPAVVAVGVADPRR